MHHPPGRCRDGLGGNIDLHAQVITVRADFRGQLSNFLSAQPDRQNRILKAIIIKNITKAFTDDAANAQTTQGPDSGFSGTAAAKVWAGNKHLCIPITVLIEDEIRVFAAIVVKAQRLERDLSHFLAFCGRNAFSGGDNIGVDIGPHQGRRDTINLLKFFHCFGSWRLDFAGISDVSGDGGGGSHCRTG